MFCSLREWGKGIALPADRNLGKYVLALVKNTSGTLLDSGVNAGVNVDLLDSI